MWWLLCRWWSQLVTAGHSFWICLCLGIRKGHILWERESGNGSSHDFLRGALPKSSCWDEERPRYISHDGSMVLLYTVTWIPSIYPLYVSINIPAPAGSVMGIAKQPWSTIRSPTMRHFQLPKISCILNLEDPVTAEFFGTLPSGNLTAIDL